MMSMIRRWPPAVLLLLVTLAGPVLAQDNPKPSREREALRRSQATL
jgi:hypothetical protein